MSFIVGMPESGSTPGNTRKLFVNELSGMRTTAAKNHVIQAEVGDDPSNQGKHIFSQFTSVSASVTAATELALYNKIISGKQRFFMRQPSSGTEIQLSGIDPQPEFSGCTFLPGGLLYQWGAGFISAKASAKAVKFPKGNADGFTLLRIIGLVCDNNNVTIGYSTTLLPSINVNDGFYAVISDQQNKKVSFGYMVIGTMT